MNNIKKLLKTVFSVLTVIGMFLLIVIAGIVCFSIKLSIKLSIILIGLLIILKVVAMITGSESIGSLFDMIINLFRK